MEHDANRDRKSTRPTLVTSHDKASTVGVNILSNIEAGKKSQQVQKPAHAGLKMWLICALLIVSASVIAYQLLNVDVAPPTLEIASKADTKPKINAALAAPVATAQSEDVAQIVNLQPERVKSELTNSNSEAEHVAETKVAADTSSKPSLSTSDTPFADLDEFSAQPTAAPSKAKSTSSGQAAQKTQPKAATAPIKQEASTINTAVVMEKTSKQELAAPKSEHVREAAKPKPKSKDYDAELIAAIISHEKVAPKSNANTRTAQPVTRNTQNSTLKVAQSMTSQEGLAGLMTQCENLDFLEKMSCRHDACAGYWGKDAQCPIDDMAEKVLGRQGRY